jgi:hypothetical protein
MAGGLAFGRPAPKVEGEEEVECVDDPRGKVLVIICGEGKI